jgi:transcriptional regulator with XRE-family HTH domain
VSIGEALAQARHQAGLTVTQVSDQTRIAAKIITGIERDDFSACGGDFYARGHIRGIARVVGINPEPLIEEYDTAQLGPQAIADDMTQPVTSIKTRGRRWMPWITALILVWLGLGAYDIFAGFSHTTSAAPVARTHPVTHRHVGDRRQAPPAPKTTTPSAIPAHKLTPASAAAFNSYGASRGDNSDLAHLAIDGNPTTAWHTDWYTTAHFGSLYPGTGLLVDMGRAMTITAARITLGSAHGADFQLRVGAAPTLADLPPVAHATDAGGVVRLRLATPAHGRYVLIWFTSLPPASDPAGTFEVGVYNLRLEGRA